LIFASYQHYAVDYNFALLHLTIDVLPSTSVLYQLRRVMRHDWLRRSAAFSLAVAKAVPMMPHPCRPVAAAGSGLLHFHGHGLPGAHSLNSMRNGNINSEGFRRNQPSLFF
jgi:hypothetical protein